MQCELPAPQRFTVMIPPDTPNNHPAPSPDLLLAAIVDSSDDAIVSKDLNGIVTSWNASAQKIFGYSKAEIIGKSVTILLPPERLAEEETILAKIRKGERVDHFQTMRRRKDGTSVEVSVTISPVRDADGSIVGASKVARDVSEQNELGRAALLLAAIVDSSQDAIVSKNLQGIITSWNHSAQAIFGYSGEEAVGRSVLMLIPQDRKDEELNILARLQKGERVEHFETIRVRKNGEHFPVSLTISPVRDKTGKIIGASKIARDISELKQVNAERDQLLESERCARARAEHANRMKDDFLATISHELRTPLNAILGWTQVLKESESLTADVMAGLETIERNARVQAQLIEDLLDLERIVSGKMTLEIERVDLREVVTDAIAAVRHAADIKAIMIKPIWNHHLEPALGDRKRLQQIVWNLIANAIKFTERKGAVTVSLVQYDSRVELVVADNGIGIAADFLPHVFERFRQAESGTTRQSGGLGIGLAIVKQLTELHGGTVRAESAGLGKGTTFTVSLPLAVSGHRSAEPVSPAGAHDAPAALTEDLSGIKVLTVDDDKDSLDVICRVLTSRKAEVRSASSVDEALMIFKDFRPHVILSDISMPKRDGYDFIRCVRTLPNGNTIPAAALTALARPEDRMRALKAGFQTHVAKPVIPGELVAIVLSLASLEEK